MARFRQVNPQVSKGRLPMQLRSTQAGLREKIGGGLWGMLYDNDEAGEYIAKSPSTNQASFKQSREGSATASPISITPKVTLGKTLHSKGQDSPFLQSIPTLVYPQHAGFNHGLNNQGVIHSTEASETSEPRGALQLQRHAANEKDQTRPIASPTDKALPEKLAVAKSKRQKYLKRSQSVATLDSGENGEDDEECERATRVGTEASSTFYIGDFEKVIAFLYHRFDELTTKPLRTMVTAWIKILEPRRQSLYGPYHKALPSEKPAHCTPPWWPRKVPYNEPSHLSKHHLNVLAVDVMLQHRKIDEVKRACPWVDKLRKAAEYAVETTPVEFFSSSKSLGFNTKMRERAMTFLLPSVFDVAQSYEDHIAQHSLYEGAGAVDPGSGKEHTWQVISKPPREVAQRKRVRAVKKRQAPSNSDAETSEAEPPIEITRKNLSFHQGPVESRKRPAPRKRTKESRKVWSQTRDTPLLREVAGQSPTPTSQQTLGLYHSTGTNISYDRSWNNQQPGESMSVAVKSDSITTYGEHMLLRTVYPQQSSSPSGFVHSAFHGQGNPGSLADYSPHPFTSGPEAMYAEPSSIYRVTYPPPMSDANCTTSMVAGHVNSYCYPYEGLFSTLPLSYTTGSLDGFSHDMKTK